MPSPLASNYIIPSMDVFLRSESGQGCRFLRDNSTTDILGPGSPIPAQKYFFFLEGNVKKREAEVAACGDNWPICSSSALRNPFLGPPAHSPLAPLLLLCSLPIVHVSHLSVPHKQQEPEMSSAAIASVQSSPHMSICPGDTYLAVFIQRLGKNRLHSWLLCKHYSVEQHLLFKSKTRIKNRYRNTR